MTVRCVVVGDVMMDVTARIDSAIAYASDTPARVTVQPGGAAANTTAWLASAGHPVTVVGAVGDDAFAHGIAAQLGELGADVRFQYCSERDTGTCVVIVDPRRERTMFPDAGANRLLRADVATGAIEPGCHVHLSGYTLLNDATVDTALAVLARARETGASVSIDAASAAPLRERVDLVRSALASVDLLLANADEATVLADDDDPYAAVAALGDLVPTVVVKLGAAGVVAHDRDGTCTIPGLTTEVVDTTGAGDAFTAGFLPVWLDGRPLAEAVGAGQRVAVLAVSRVGASPLVH